MNFIFLKITKMKRISKLALLFSKLQTYEFVLVTKKDSISFLNHCKTQQTKVEIKMLGTKILFTLID